MRKRIFNARQRIALFIRAQGHCLGCNELLAPSFHADHIMPFSKGGATEVQNGQALCPTCNLKKSDKIESIHLNKTVRNAFWFLSSWFLQLRVRNFFVLLFLYFQRMNS